MTQGFTLYVPKLLKYATDAIIDHDFGTVSRSAMAMIAIAVFAATFRILSRTLLFNSGRAVEYDLRADLFNHLLAQGPNFFRELPHGQVMSRLVNDITQVRLVLGPGLLNITNTTLTYLFVIPILLFKDWSLTLACLSPFPLLLLLGRLFARKLYRLSAESQECLGDLSNRVQENLNGTMTVRAYGQEDTELQRFEKLNEKYLKVNIALASLRGYMFPVMGITASLGSIILLGLGGYRIIQGQMTVGDYAEFAGYLTALVWPTIALGWIISMVQRGMASMDRINQIFTFAPILTDGKNDLQAETAHITIKDLNFRHNPEDPITLKDINAEIKPGEFIVMVGRTGSGKTTLLQLLARLTDAPKKSIFVNEKDINDLSLGDVRGLIAYAPQDAFLFTRSIENNVGFGNNNATSDEIRRALAIACFDLEVSAFPEGIDTVVGERGVTLSGGQRQRTTLARALIANRQILLLDDTLSAVDTETESKILDSLTSQRGQRTIILATHRLACAQRADRIWVLDKGELAEQGTESELLAKDGIYAQMHRRQRLREAINTVQSSQTAQSSKDNQL